MCVYGRTVASDLPIVEPFDDRWMIIEHWWVDDWCGGGGKVRCWDMNLFHSNFLCHKYDVNSSGIEPRAIQVQHRICIVIFYDIQCD